MKMYSQKSGGCCGIRMLFEPGKPQPGAACENYPPLYGTYPFCFLAGCGVVGTETGAPNETYTAVPECHGEEALQTFITNLRPVVKYAEQMGVSCHRAGMEAYRIQPRQSQKSAG